MPHTSHSFTTPKEFGSKPDQYPVNIKIAGDSLLLIQFPKNAMSNPYVHRIDPSPLMEVS